MPASANSKRSAWWWLAVTLCLPYAAVVLAFFPLRFLLPGWPAFLVLFSFLGPFLYLPLVVLLPLAFLSHSRAAQAACLVVLALFLTIYLPFFAPRPGSAPPLAGSPFKAMAFNLGPMVSQPAQLASAIAFEDADIVALEELYPAASQKLQETLSGRYPYMILPPELGASGLLSAFPITDYEFFRPAGLGRAALRATLEVEGEPLHVLVIHPEPPTAQRNGEGPFSITFTDQGQEAQMADIAERAAGLPGPVLVLGDFNLSDQSRAYVVLTQALQDAFWEAGWGFGFTFPQNQQPDGIIISTPVIRIDYIFHSAQLYAWQAAAGCRGSSDHCYVVAELQCVAVQ